MKKHLWLETKQFLEAIQETKRRYADGSLDTQSLESGINIVENQEGF